LEVFLLDDRLTYYEKQAILFTKGNFHRRGDQLDLLKWFAVRQYGIDVQYLSRENFYAFILGLFLKLRRMGLIQLTDEDILTDIFINRYGIQHIGIRHAEMYYFACIQGCDVDGIDFDPVDQAMFPAR
jgi:hypothetical protein